MSEVTIVHRSAPAGLEEVVSGLWFVAGPAPTPYERILPSPEIALVVPLTTHPYRVHTGSGWRVLGGSFVAGLRQQAAMSSNGPSLGNVGAIIRPDALRAIALDPVSLAGGVRDVAGFAEVEALGAGVDGDAAMDALTRVLRDRLIEAWRPDAVVRAAIVQLAADPQPRLSDVARMQGVSPPALVARFRAATGVTPKAYADLLRLHGLLDRLTVAALSNTSTDGGTAARIAWSDLAVEAGYYDQSHLTRAFHRFVGLTPTAYFDLVRGRGPDAVRFIPEEEAPDD